MQNCKSLQAKTPSLSGICYYSCMTFLIAIVLFALLAYLFVLFIVKRDRGHREPTTALFAAMGFGFLGVVVAMVLEGILIPSSVMESVNGGTVLPTSQIVGATLAIGLIEEAAKSIPLALFLYRKKYFDELTDGIIYFGISALTFALVEDLVYTIGYGGGVGIMRAVMTPYVHIGFSILFGLTLAYCKVLKKPKWFAVFGFAAAVLAHGAYDFLAFSDSLLYHFVLLLLAIGLNIGLFVLFRRAQKGDEARGESAIGENKFCRHCGQPNPKHLLYCSHCGKLS